MEEGTCPVCFEHVSLEDHIACVRLSCRACDDMLVHRDCHMKRMKSIMHNTQMIKNGFALNFPCPQKNCPGKIRNMAWLEGKKNEKKKEARIQAAIQAAALQAQAKKPLPAPKPKPAPAPAAPAAAGKGGAKAAGNNPTPVVKARVPTPGQNPKLTKEQEAVIRERLRATAAAAKAELLQGGSTRSTPEPGTAAIRTAAGAAALKPAGTAAGPAAAAGARPGAAGAWGAGSSGTQVVSGPATVQDRLKQELQSWIPGAAWADQKPRKRSGKRGAQGSGTDELPTTTKPAALLLSTESSASDVGSTTITPAQAATTPEGAVPGAGAWDAQAQQMRETHALQPGYVNNANSYLQLLARMGVTVEGDFAGEEEEEEEGEEVGDEELQVEGEVGGEEGQQEWQQQQQQLAHTAMPLTAAAAVPGAYGMAQEPAGGQPLSGRAEQGGWGGGGGAGGSVTGSGYEQVEQLGSSQAPSYGLGVEQAGLEEEGALDPLLEQWLESNGMTEDGTLWWMDDGIWFAAFPDGTVKAMDGPPSEAMIRGGLGQAETPAIGRQANTEQALYSAEEPSALAPSPAHHIPPAAAPLLYAQQPQPLVAAAPLTQHALPTQHTMQPLVQQQGQGMPSLWAVPGAAQQQQHAAPAQHMPMQGMLGLGPQQVPVGMWGQQQQPAVMQVQQPGLFQHMPGQHTHHQQALFGAPAGVPQQPLLAQAQQPLLAQPQRLPVTAHAPPSAVPAMAGAPLTAKAVAPSMWDPLSHLQQANVAQPLVRVANIAAPPASAAAVVTAATGVSLPCTPAAALLAQLNSQRCSVHKMPASPMGAAQVAAAAGGDGEGLDDLMDLLGVS